jgi:hypothetical protein
MCVVGTAHRRPLGSAIVVSEVLNEHLRGPTSCRPSSVSVRKLFPPLEPLGWPFATPPPPAMEWLVVKMEAST